MALPPSSLVFKVYRREPELITPAKPTLCEIKLLSDIDDQEGFRFQVPVIQFYRNNPSMQGKDPVKVIREALAKTLVFYYPFAGRLREGPNRKLMVECTGEGIMFIEADADITVEQFGDPLHPPFPCFEELFFDVPGSAGMLNSPLLLIQVTRLKCGGFVLAIRLNHTMSDAFGLFQFMSAVGEIARGAPAPFITPVWDRHIFNARKPPHVTCTHREYDKVANTSQIKIPPDNMVHGSIFFDSTKISAIRSLLPHHLCGSSTFELITACIWKCRTIALQPNPNEEMCMMCIVNSRNKFNNPSIPKGYYGNAFVFPAAVATAEELSRNPLGYALELIKKAKSDVMNEYIQSVADLMVIQGRPPLTTVRSLVVSDNTRAGFKDVDFGWGKADYGGPAKAGGANIPELVSYYVAVTNKKGEDGIAALISLPAYAMERFVKELDAMLNVNVKSTFILSAL